ncbi:hypothetical protein BGC07_02830 [Piscirickettsia litoralis]|uniref:Purine-nucleoside phosphorylase n=1 Tax=Piscirickettsia litoralis TaxID=1891921 RepID=A0ABX3A8L9_9GAMM|nr:hypothetical protein BGC07_02830 [Piscirickettsia litoralis]
MKAKIFISSCLVGANVRYHGGNALFNHPILRRWQEEGRIITSCPEVMGGATIPRPPSEITTPGAGTAVIQGQGHIQNQDGTDVTELYLKGAQSALGLAKQYNIKIAILKENSPSCGSHFIYSGKFNGTRIPGQGVTTTLLSASGIKVFNENQLEKADSYLKRLAI